MPLFTPGRRWQPPYLPFKNQPLDQRALAILEQSIKGPLFGCRMCGNCLLQETAFICPMECPKGARNGPCAEGQHRNIAMLTKHVLAFGMRFIKDLSQ